MNKKELLGNKINFTLFVTVNGANPNGDPLESNRPRTDIDGFGFMTQECIKRKLRNRLQNDGKNVLLQNPELDNFDGFSTTRQRVEDDAYLLEMMKSLTKKSSKDKKEENAPAKKASKQEFNRAVCEKWIDVRLFGGVFAYKLSEGGFSSGIRGAVSFTTAKSLDVVDIDSMQITKIQPAEEERESDTMGMRHVVPFAVYKLTGSIDVQIAQHNGVTIEDVDAFKHALLTLFQNDISSARPDGSMSVSRLYWWEHKEALPVATTAKINEAFSIERVAENKRFDDYKIEWQLDNCVEPEVIDL